MEFSVSPAGPDLCVLPPKCLLNLSVRLSDFVAGVPKGLMLYGSVRRLNHHFHLGAFGMGEHGTNVGGRTKGSGLNDTVTAGDCIIHRY